jgi:hypothetical protein
MAQKGETPKYRGGERARAGDLVRKNYSEQPAPQDYLVVSIKKGEPDIAIMLFGTRDLTPPVEYVLASNVWRSGSVVIPPVSSEKRPPTVRQPLRKALGYIFAGIIGLFGNHYFVLALPKPHVQSSVFAERGQSGSAVGCTLYMFQFFADEPVDRAYWKVQLPNVVSRYNVGHAVEAHRPLHKIPFQGVVSAFGKDAAGRCQLYALNPDSIDIQSSASGNEVTVHAANLTQYTYILLSIVTPNDQSAISPAATYFEGDYQYTILGQVVRRPIPFRFNGITD